MRVDDALVLYHQSLGLGRHTLRTHAAPEAATSNAAVPATEASVATVVAGAGASVATSNGDVPGGQAQQTVASGRGRDSLTAAIAALQEEAHVTVHDVVEFEALDVDDVTTPTIFTPAPGLATQARRMRILAQATTDG